MSAPVSPPAPSRRRRWVVLAVVLLAGGATTMYFLARPAPPAIPDVDLSAADAEVAAAVTKAIDRVKADPRNGVVWGQLGMVLRAHDFDTACVQAFAAAEKFDPPSARWPYLAGLTIIQFDPDAGVECLRRAVARSTESQVEPRLRLAEILLDRGKIDEAETLASAVAKRRPDDPRAAFVLARVLAERGDWAGVIAKTESLRTDPTARRRVALLRADALHRLGRTADAEGETRHAVELPEDARWDDRYVDDVERLQVGSAVDLRRGQELLGAGQYPDAVAALERAAEKAHDPTPARLLLGRALNEVGNPDAAVRVLEQVVRARPDSVDGWFQLGVSHLLGNDPTQATKAFDRVVKLKPDHALGYFNLGQSRRKLGDRRSAEEAFEAALRSRPNYDDARKALAELRGGK